jgi:hypothetical protein
MLLFFSPKSASTVHVSRNHKRIATVTNGVVRPKRRLTKEDAASIRVFAVTELLAALKDRPAFQDQLADAFGIEQTWPVP